MITITSQTIYSRRRENKNHMIKQTAVVLSIIISLVMLGLSAIFGTVLGVLFFENISGNRIIFFSVAYILLGLLGALLLSKLKKEVRFIYLLVIFPIAGLSAGSTRLIASNNDGVFIILVAITFLVFYLLSKKYLSKKK